MIVRSVLMLSAAPVIVMATPVVAQQAPQQTQASSSRGVEDIVVTARRRQESAQSVPVSVTAFSAEKLAERSVTQMDQLTYSTPGLTYGRAGGTNNPQIVIRGQSRANIGDAPQPVLTYIDDVPLPADGSIVPTYDLASVQVLKGPQGTLFGRNSTTGAVLIYSQQPTYDFGGYLQAGYGNYDRKELEGAINVPLVAEQVSLRAAGKYIKRDGYTKNLSGFSDFDNQDDTSFRVSLRIDPTDFIKSTTTYEQTVYDRVGDGPILHYIYQNSELAAGTTNTLRSTSAPTNFAALYDNGLSPLTDIDLALAQQQQAGNRATYSEYEPSQYIKTTGISNTTQIELGDFTLKNIIARRTAKVSSFTNTDGSAMSLLNAQSEVNQRQFSEELQLQGNLLDGKLQTIVGGFYLQNKPGGTGSSLALSNFYSSPFVPPTVIQSYRTSTSKAVFGAATYRLDEVADGLKINVGLRQTWDDVKACAAGYPATNLGVGKVSPTSLLLTPAECEVASGPTGIVKAINGTARTIVCTKISSKSDALTWNVGLDYQATPDLFVYGVVRRGYRSGGVNTPLFNPAAPNTLTPYQTYKPETVTDVEIGLKSDWRAGDLRGRFNISAYRGIYKGSQRGVNGLNRYDGDGIGANDPSAGTIVANLGTVKVQGIDVDALVSPAEWISFSAFASYTDAKYTDLGGADAAFFAGAAAFPATLDGQAFPYAPKFTLGGNIRLSHDFDGVGKAVFNFDGYHSSRVWFTPFKSDLSLSEAGYELFNARLDIEDIGGSPISAGFYVRNLFDKEYIAAGAQTARSAGFNAVIYNEPRMYGVQLKYRFGK
ncbi:MAG: hypothetical protein FP826_04065 [Sphingomonadales bacterium]|nr:hypothetical protein [Sphingomonadales bacterium]MBU3991335.1 TonB-dependent receptor [Alphaproteobacteria bacterium]